MDAGEECDPGLADDCKNDCTYSYLHYLVHRYSFDTAGTDVVDSVGNADGVTVNTTLPGNGAMSLAGGTSNEYADLPNGLASAQTNATFEAWLTWYGGDIWQRIFDFGSSDQGESQGEGVTYLFLTPHGWDESGGLRAAFTTNGIPEETFVEAETPLETGVLSHVALVIDDDNDLMALYRNGALDAEVEFTKSLSSLNDINSWLGQSQFSWDPDLEADVDEFRIYRTALSADDLAESFAAGPEL